MSNVTLDARGLSCPLPILKAKQALSRMEGGERLEVMTTDPGSVDDFEAFCRTTGNALIDSAQSGDVYSYTIERRA